MLFLRSKGQVSNQDKGEPEPKAQRKVSGSSAESLEGAIADAVRKATGLGEIAEAKIKHVRLAVEGGKVTEYTVELKFSSPSESDEDDEDEDEEDDD
jgi:flavin-binding protein dodecin